MEIYVRNTAVGFVPLTETDYEEKQKLKLDEDYKVTITQARNIKFHRKFFALLNLTVCNMPERIQKVTGIESVEAMLMALKIDLGYFDIVEVKGHSVVKPRSISFAKMSQEDFERFYDLAITDILNNYLRGTDREALEEEVRRFIT